MENLNLISNFAEFKDQKNIDKSTMIGVLEDVLRHALQKQFESDENFDVIINPEKGDLEIWRNREVVEDGAVENPNTQISVSEVKAIRALSYFYLIKTFKDVPFTLDPSIDDFQNYIIPATKHEKILDYHYCLSCCILASLLLCQQH